MPSNVIKIALTAMLLASPLALAACDDNDGAGEQIGEQIDEGVSDSKRALEDATD